MSGHSKWSQIKRQKGLNDVKKGAVYTKVAKQIVLAARQGGDPSVNFSLRMAIDKAKAVNMPSDNIEKAIKKGTGEAKDAATIESMTYEAYGIGGAVFLIDVLTDNRNRSAADIRMLIEKNGGRMVEAGAISWQFTVLGLITLVSETEEEKEARLHKKWNDTTDVRRIPTAQGAIEEFEMRVMDMEGVVDIQSEMHDGLYTISMYTVFTELDAIRKAIEYDPSLVEIIKKAQTDIVLDEAAIEGNTRLLDVLEENDDVDTVWHNIENI